MSDGINFVEMFEGLSPEDARELAGRLRAALTVEADPNRILQCVKDVYQSFTHERT